MNLALVSDPRDEPDAAPSNLMAEMAVLGAILFDNSALDAMPAGLKPASFHEPFHQRLFDVVAQTIRAGRLADPNLLVDRLRGDPAFAALGGVAYLADLIDRAPAQAHVAEYGREVQDAALRRDLIHAASTIIKNARDAGASGLDRLNEAGRALDALTAGAPSHAAWKPAHDVAVQAVQTARERAGRIDLPFGLADLDKNTGGLRRGEMTIIAGRPAMGKAQPLHSRILLADGSWTTMGDVRVGDAIASTDGASSIVVGTHDRGDRETFRVTMSDGRFTEACGDHLWRVVSRHWTAPRVISTVELQRLLTTVRHKNRLSVDMVSGDFGASTDLPIDPYVLGAILGDGSIVSGDRVGFTSADPEIVLSVQQRLPSGVAIRRAPGRFQYTIGRTANTGPNPMIDRLRDLGLMGCRSEQKSIPPQYLAASRADRLSLLQGLMDTDGWAEKLGAVRFCSTSFDLAKGVEYLARSLGAAACIKSRIPNCHAKGVKTPGQRSYTVKIRHPNGEQFFALERKSSRAIRGRNSSVRLNVASVDPCGVQAVRCITVSHPSSLYVTDDFIVTHNSSAGLAVARSLASRGKGVAFFSMEMPDTPLGLRMACDEAFDRHSPVYCGRSRNPTYFAAERHELDADQWRDLEAAAGRIAGWPLMFDTRPGLTPSVMESAARKAFRDWERQGVEPGAVIVDHLTIARSETDRKGNKVAEVGDVSRALAEMAKRLNVPVVALCQLSRQVEARGNTDRRPELADLRWSGEIEQDARQVIFLYRPEYYVKPPENEADFEAMAEYRAELDKVRNKLFWLVRKNNNGPVCQVETFCDIACSAIRDREAA